MQCLDKLFLNLRWSWHHPMIDLFRALDADLWEEPGRNARLLLGRIDPRRLIDCRPMKRSSNRWTVSPQASTNISPEPAGSRARIWKRWEFESLISRWEFGLTECIPNYVGGLGILAGDHLKSASDPGLPEDPVLPHELAWIRWQE
jgi:starch phosphorylase